MLLNNDVVVTDGWLDQLIALVNAKTGGHSAEGLPEEWRPTVSAVAWSGDPRPTLAQLRPENLALGCSGAVPLGRP